MAAGGVILGYLINERYPFQVMLVQWSNMCEAGMLSVVEKYIIIIENIAIYIIWLIYLINFTLKLVNIIK